MNKLLLRALTGACYVGLIIGSLLWGKLLGFTLLCCLFTLLGMYEFLKMTKGNIALHSFTTTLDILIGLSVTSSLYLSRGTSVSLWLMLAEITFLILLRGVMQLYTGTRQPATDMGLSALSVIYVALPMAVATYLDIFVGAPYMLLIFIMVWLNDTGAYLVGSTIGKHRLFERLSPKKSWEGFWGGALFCVATGWLAPTLFPQYFAAGPPALVGLGLMVCVFSTWGDLFESMIKRAAGVKDSGNILPGHGGILDRIDSLLFVFPAAAIYLYFITSI